jgi:hypothetical protein
MRSSIASRTLQVSSLSKAPFGAIYQRPLSSFAPPPSPPRLPKEEQEIFEELQRRSTGAFSTPRADPTQADNAAQSATTTSQSSGTTTTSSTASALDTQIKAAGQGDELHPHVRRGAPPEFEGDTNPKTGEVNGPKNEPLRWGASGDYSYNGRVTDF